MEADISSYLICWVQMILFVEFIDHVDPLSYYIGKKKHGILTINAATRSLALRAVAFLAD